MQHPFSATKFLLLLLASIFFSFVGGGHNNHNQGGGCCFFIFAAAARPPDCVNGTSFSAEVTYTLLEADNNYNLQLSCAYPEGLVIKGATSATLLNRIKIEVFSTTIRKKFSIDPSILLGPGSSITIRDSFITDMNTIAIAAGFKATAADVPNLISVLRNTILFNIATSGNGLQIGTTSTTLANAQGASGITIEGNRIEVDLGVVAASPRMISVNYLAQTIGLAVPVFITDNTLRCSAALCVSLSGAITANITGNAITSTTSTAYPMLESRLYSGGAINWAGTNTMQNRYNFDHIQMDATPITRDTAFVFRGTTSNLISIYLNYYGSIDTFGRTTLDVSECTFESNFFASLSNQRNPATSLNFFRSIALAAVTVQSAVFYSPNQVIDFSEMNFLKDALTLTSVSFDGLIKVHDSNFTGPTSTIYFNGLTARDNAAISIQRNVMRFPPPSSSLYAIRISGLSRTGIISAPPDQRRTIIRNNVLEFSGGSSYGIQFISTVPTANVALHYLDIAENSVNLNGNGYALDLSCEDTEVAVVANKLVATTGTVKAIINGGRIFIDDSNVYAAYGGAFTVQFNTRTPLNLSTVIVRNVQLSSITIQTATTMVPQFFTAIVENVILTGAIIVNLPAVPTPTVSILNIKCLGTTPSTYTFNLGSDWYHNSSSYNGGLLATVAAKDASIFIEDVFVGEASAASYFSSWQLTANRNIFISRNVIRNALGLTATQDGGNSPNLTVTQNTVTNTRNIYGASIGKYASLGIRWSRINTVGNPAALIQNNSVNFGENNAASYAFVLVTDDTATSVAFGSVTITGNTFDSGVGNGHAMHITARKIDLVSQLNTLTAGGSNFYFYASLVGSRVFFDESNTIVNTPAGGGVIAIAQTTEPPRDDSLLAVANVNLYAIRYSVPISLASQPLPQRCTVSVRNVRLAQDISISTGDTLSPAIELSNIQTAITASTFSKYQFKNINFNHSGCSYYGGLDLDLVAPHHVILSDLIVRKVSIWNLNVKAYINVHSNDFDSVYVQATQSGHNHMLLFDHNRATCTNDFGSSPRQYRRAVAIEWTRSGTGNAYLSVMNNTVTFDSSVAMASTANTVAIYIDSTTPASTATNLNAIVFRNTIRAQDGSALSVRLINADLNVFENNWNATNFYVQAALTNVKMTFDDSNVINTLGFGAFQIEHTNPRNGNVFNVSSYTPRFITYTNAPASAAPTGEVVSITNLILTQVLTVDLASSVLPVLVIENIRALGTGPSSIKVKTIDFHHHDCVYKGALNLVVVAPTWVLLEDLAIGAQSTWDLTAPQKLIVRRGELPATRLNVLQSLADPTITFEDNNVVVTENAAGAYFAWNRRNLVGRCTLTIQRNTMRFSPSSTNSNLRGIQLDSNDASATDADILIDNNTMWNIDSGFAFFMQVRNANIFIAGTNKYNLLNHYLLYGILTSCALVADFSAPDQFYTSTGMDYYVSLSQARDNSYVAIANKALMRTIYHNIAAADVTPLNHSFIVERVNLNQVLTLNMGNCIQPYVRVIYVDVVSTTKSTIAVKNVDFIHNYSSYRAGVDLAIASPNSIVLHNLALGATSSWKLTQGQALSISHCTLQALAIEPVMTNTTAEPTIIVHNNTIQSTSPSGSSPYGGQYALLIGWTRPTVVSASQGLTGALLVTNNNINFTAGSATTASIGLYVYSKGTSPTPIDILIDNNTITSPNGGCITTIVDAADVTIANNVLLATNPAGHVYSAVLNAARVYFDQTNSLLAYGGGVQITHSTYPRNFNYVNVSDRSIGYFRYSQPNDAAQASYGDVLSLERITLVNEITVALGYASLPLVVLESIISNAGLCSYQLRTDVFEHKFSTYRGGLTLDITAPYVTLYNINANAATVSDWTIRAGRYLNVSNNVVGALYLSPTMEGYVQEPTVIVVNNTIRSAAPTKRIYPPGSSYFDFSGGLLVQWTRAGLGVGQFIVAGNNVSFTTASGSYGIYLSATGVGTDFARVEALIDNNYVDTAIYSALHLAAFAQASIVITNNVLKQRAISHYSLYASISDARIHFDPSNAMVAGGGGIYVTNARPRSGNYFNISNGVLGFVRYVHSTNDVSYNDTVALTNIVVQQNFDVNTAYSDNPTYVLDQMLSNGQMSYISMRVNEFIFRENQFKLGLSLTIYAPVRVDIRDIILGTPSCIWRFLCAPKIASIHDNALSGLLIDLVQTPEVISPIFHFFNNSILSANEAVPYGWFTDSFYYGLAIRYNRASNYARQPTLIFEQNTVEFIQTLTTSRAFHLYSQGAALSHVDNFAFLLVRNNEFYGGMGHSLVVTADHMDVTILKNKLYGSQTTASGVFANGRVTYDDSNQIVPVNAGAISFTFTAQPRAGSFFVVTNKRLSALTFSVTSAEKVRNVTVYVSNVQLLNAITIRLSQSVQPYIVTNHITAGASSTIQVEDVPHVFIHEYCTYQNGINMDVTSIHRIILRNLVVGGISSYRLVTESDLIQFVDSQLGEMTFSPSANGVDAVIDFARNNVSASIAREMRWGSYFYPMVYVVWDRQRALGSPRFDILNNRFQVLGSISTTGHCLYFGTVGTPSSMASLNIRRNVFKTPSHDGINVREENRIDLTVQENTFTQNPGTIRELFGCSLTSSRVTFDNTNVIPEGGGSITAAMTDPREANIIVITSNVYSFSFTSSGGVQAKCDRIALIDAQIQGPTITVQYNMPMYNSEITMWGVRSSTARMSLSQRYGLDNSFARVENCKVNGISSSFALRTVNSTVRIINNAFTDYSSLTHTGLTGSVDVSSNNFTTLQNTPALTLALTLGNQIYVILANNRMVLTTYGTVALQSTCSPHGGATNRNVSFIVKNNFIHASGVNSIVGCNGITVLQNNRMSTMGTINLETVSGALLVDNSNTFAGCTVSIVSSGEASLLSADLRYVNLLAFTFGVSSGDLKASSLRLETVQTTSLVIKPESAEASTVLVSGCVVTGATTFTTGRAPPTAIWTFLNTQFALGFTASSSTSAMSALISPKSIFVLDGCAIGQILTLTLQPYAHPIFVTNNVIKTASAVQSSISVQANGVFALFHKNTFSQVSSTSKLLLQLANPSAMTKGTVMSKNSFDISVTLSVSTYGTPQLVANTFTQAFAASVAGTNARAALYGNMFSTIGTVTVEAANTLVAGCNTNAAASGAAVKFQPLSANAQDIDCAASTTVGFCGNTVNGPITDYPTQTETLCNPSLPTADSSSSLHDSLQNPLMWGSLPTAFDSASTYAAFYSVPPTIYWLAPVGICPFDPIYTYKNITWPPPELMPKPTTTPEPTTTASTTGPPLPTIEVLFTTETKATTTIATTKIPTSTTAFTSTQQPSSSSTTVATTAATAATTRLSTDEVSISATAARTSGEQGIEENTTLAAGEDEATTVTTLTDVTSANTLGPVTTRTTIDTQTADNGTPGPTNPLYPVIPTDDSGQTIAPTWPSAATIPTGASGETIAPTWPSAPTDATNQTIASTEDSTDANDDGSTEAVMTEDVVSDSSSTSEHEENTGIDSSSDLSSPTLSETSDEALETSSSESTSETMESSTNASWSRETIAPTWPSAATIPTDASGETIAPTWPSAATIPTDASGQTIAPTWPSAATIPTDASGETIAPTWPSAATIPTDASGQTIASTEDSTEANDDGSKEAVMTEDVVSDSSSTSEHEENTGIDSSSDLSSPTLSETADEALETSSSESTDLAGDSSSFDNSTYCDEKSTTNSPTESLIESSDAASSSSVTTQVDVETSANANGTTSFSPTAVPCPTIVVEPLPQSIVASVVSLHRSAIIKWSNVIRNGSEIVSVGIPFSSHFSSGIETQWSLLTTHYSSGAVDTATVDAVGSRCHGIGYGAFEDLTLVCNISQHRNWETIQAVRQQRGYTIRIVLNFSSATVNFNTMAVVATNTTVVLDVTVDLEPELEENSAALSEFDTMLAQTVDDTGLLFVGDPFSLEVHLATAFLLGPCAAAGDLTMARIARYVDLSPFIDMGAATVAIAHSLIASMLFVLHAAATLYYSKDKALPFARAASKLAFPSVSFIVAVLLYPGTTVSVMDMLREDAHHNNASPIEPLALVGLLLGFLHLLWVPAVALAALFALQPNQYGQYRLAASHPSSASSPSSLLNKDKEDGTAKQSVSVGGGGAALFRPCGVWDPLSRRSMLGLRGFVQGKSLANGKLVVPLSIALAVAFSALLFTTKKDCGARTLVASALVIVAAITVAVVRPLVTRFANITTVAALLALGVLVLVHGVALETSMAGAEGGGPLWTVKLLALIVLFVVTILRTIHFAILAFSKPPLPIEPFCLSLITEGTEDLDRAENGGGGHYLEEEDPKKKKNRRDSVASSASFIGSTADERKNQQQDQCQQLGVAAAADNDGIEVDFGIDDPEFEGDDVLVVDELNDEENIEIAFNQKDGSDNNCKGSRGSEGGHHDTKSGELNSDKSHSAPPTTTTAESNANAAVLSATSDAANTAPIVLLAPTTAEPLSSPRSATDAKKTPFTSDDDEEEDNDDEEKEATNNKSASGRKPTVLASLLENLFVNDIAKMSSADDAEEDEHDADEDDDDDDDMADLIPAHLLVDNVPRPIRDIGFHHDDDDDDFSDKSSTAAKRAKKEEKERDNDDNNESVSVKSDDKDDNENDTFVAERSRKILHVVRGGKSMSDASSTTTDSEDGKSDASDEDHERQEVLHDETNYF